MPSEGGDREAVFGEFYRYSVARLVGQSIRIGVPAAEAPGVVQDLMVEIYRRWPEIGSPTGYAAAVLPHRAARFLKLSAREQATQDTDLPCLGRPLTAHLPDGILTVDGERLVLAALEQLPPVQRAVFALTYDDYPSAEIAEILIMEEVTVRSHLRHARRKLRIWWTEEPPAGKRGGGRP